VSYVKRILIDMDDCTCQFRQGYVDLVNELFGTEHTLEEVSIGWDCDKDLKLSRSQKSLVWRTMNSHGWAQTLKPMPGAIEAIKRLKVKYEVIFVTKQLVTSDTWGYDRYRWIKKHLGAKFADDLHCTRKKYSVDGDYLIEDNVVNCEDWLADRKLRSKHPARVILYAWPYNENHDLCATKATRLPDWKSILKSFGC
jgi:5'(3')-deoxyribonucleotidase